MKNIYLLLSAALVLGACQSDALDEASVQPNTPTTTIIPLPHKFLLHNPMGPLNLATTQHRPYGNSCKRCRPNKPCN